MKADPYKVNSLVVGPDVDPLPGDVRWDATRTIWNVAMLLTALIPGPLYFTLDKPGLARDVQTAESLPVRRGITPLSPAARSTLALQTQFQQARKLAA